MVGLGTVTDFILRTKKQHNLPALKLHIADHARVPTTDQRVPTTEQIIAVLNYLLDSYTDILKKRNELTAAISQVHEREFWLVHEDMVKKGIH